MKERPILFSAPMVRALLDGTKTQTRRAVSRGNSVLDWDGNSLAKWGGLDLSTAKAFSAQTKGASVGSPDGVVSLHACASGLPGYRPGERTSHRIYPRWRPRDRLWVRETWLARSEDAKGKLENDRRRAEEDAQKQLPWAHVVYAADGWERKRDGEKWRPSIFMPRWASRITLEITEVRVQRLHDISEEDAIAEGVERAADGVGWRGYDTGTCGVLGAYVTARGSFFSLWRAINGSASEAANPWVWALTFKRVTP